MNEDNVSVDATVASDALSVSPEMEDKGVPQEIVNKRIGEEKAKARERERRMVQAEYEQKIAELKSQNAQAASRGEVQQSINVDQVAQQVREQIFRQLQEEEESLKQKEFEEFVVESQAKYKQKMAEGWDGAEDFESVMSDFYAEDFPVLTTHVAQFENAPAIMYELVKNPQKLSTILNFTQNSQKTAYAMLKKMNDSINSNKNAVANASSNAAPAPINRVQPSNKTTNHGQMSVGDWRQDPDFRV